MREALSHEEFENYLTLLSRTLRLRSGQSEAIAEELRLHLEERLGELTDRGVDPKKAVNIALGEFGDATALANKFTEISRMKRRRVMVRSMVGGFCIAAVIFAMAMTVWPQAETNFLGIAHAEPAVKKAPDNSVQLTLADRANQYTREKLKEAAEVDYIDRPLNEVVMELKEKLGVNIYLDTVHIEAIGLSPDTPINAQFKGVPMEFVLRTKLKELELAYYIDSGVVMITTQEEMELNPTVRMYDVKSLFGEDRRTRAKSTPAGGDAMGGGGFGGTVETPSFEACMGDELINTITTVIAPESWQKLGGPGSLSMYRGILVVRQSEAVHEEIGKLLDQLRDKLPPSGTVATYPSQPAVGQAGRRSGGGDPLIMGDDMGMAGGMSGGMDMAPQTPPKPKKAK